jgi:hypothetical protein
MKFNKIEFSEMFCIVYEQWEYSAIIHTNLWMISSCNIYYGVVSRVVKLRENLLLHG